MRYARIVGLGKYLPHKVLNNFDLEKMVDTSDEWITARTGIKERRIAQGGTGASQLAVEASKVALKRAGLKPENLELIIVATVTPDTQFPSTACYVQNLLKADKACCFDISAACTGFICALICAQGLIESGLYKNALVVGSEVLSCITDWEDRATCVLFGDGAGAAVLTTGTKRSFISSHMGADGSKDKLLVLPGGGSRNPTNKQTIKHRLHYIKMSGNELFRLAVRAMTEAAEKALKKARISIKDVSFLIPHQANIRIINAVTKALRIPREKVYVNIERYGNTSAATTAIALCEAWEEKRIKKDDIIVLDAFGGGLVWGALVIRWTQ